MYLLSPLALATPLPGTVSGRLPLGGTGRGPLPSTGDSNRSNNHHVAGVLLLQVCLQCLNLLSNPWTDFLTESESKPASWNSLLAPDNFIPDNLPSSEIILWDVRHKKATDSDGKTIPKSTLSQHAIVPSVNRLCLLCPELPWKISVANPKGITVADVLHSVFETLNVQITESEYWLASDDAQKRMNGAYLDATHEKTGVPGRDPKEGVKRVDYLGDLIFFNGIRPVQEEDEIFVEKRLASTPRKPDEVWIIQFMLPEQ